jgi:hypothetical protein
MLDIADVRKRCHNSIRNTATGKYLAEALREIESLRVERDKLVLENQSYERRSAILREVR